MSNHENVRRLPADQVRVTKKKTDKKAYFVHKSAYIDPGVQIGEHSKIWHFCHIQSGAVIEKHTILGQNVNIGPNVRIGNHVKIQNNVSVYEGVELEDYVFCGPSMVFTNILNPRCEFPQNDSSQYIKTIVHRGASLGANSTIVCGVEVGQYAFVGAGAVVTRSIPDFALVMGVPAHLYGWMCRCGAQLQLSIDPQSDESATCLSCKRHYIKTAYLITET